MSIVTSGANNFASDWADAINYPGVVRKSQTGEITHYKPAGDTDTERGDALALALAAVVDGDTVNIPRGTYIIGNDEFKLSGVSGVTIIGNNAVVKHNNTATAVNQHSFEIEYTCSDIVIDSLVMYTEVLDATYTGGNAYNLTFNSSGVVRNCHCILYTTVTALDGGTGFKTLVHLEDSGALFENCIIHSFASEPSFKNSMFIGAFHSGVSGLGADALAFRGCSFLNQNVTDENPFMGNPREMIDCYSNTLFYSNIGIINQSGAVGLCHSSVASLYDSTFYKALWFADDVHSYKGTYEIDASGGSSGSVDLITVSRSTGITNKAYTLTLHDNKNCYWKVHVRGTTVTDLIGTETVGLVDYTFTVTADSDTIAIDRNGADINAGLRVEFAPLYERSSTGALLQSCTLNLIDVEEQ